METEQNAIDYQAVLADLEAKKGELDQAIAAIKRIVGDPGLSLPAGSVKHPSHGATLTPTAFFGMSVAEGAKKYLSIVKEPKTTPDIATALQDHGMKTVSKNFTVTVYSGLDRRRIEVGDIVRPKRGLWGLAEWYPGMRKERKENGDKKDGAGSTDKKTDAQQKPKQSKPVAENKKAKPLAGDAATSTGTITVEAFEQFVREKARRVKEVTAHFGVSKAAIKKLLEPASKVYIAGIGWLKVRE
jgi:hypothetical protein